MPPKEQDKHVTFRCPPSVWARFSKHAKRNHRTASHLLRALIEAELKQDNGTERRNTGS